MRQSGTIRKGTIRVRRHGSKLRNIVLGLQVGVLLSFGIGIGLVAGTFFSVSRELPKVTDYSPPEATKIYSSDNILLATVGQENRQFVELNEIPKNLQNATVAIEDSRFREHGGVDFKGIARAVFKNIRGHDLREGGSTITQQLARNVYLSPKKTVSRKVREAVLAVLIERNYTKDRILELYLNQVYYGSTAFGVEAASEIYFGKPVSQLNLSECALIAGLPKSPSTLSPHENLEGAINRRDVVLSRMAELHYITQEQCESAKAKTPDIVPYKAMQYRSKAPYFTDYVKRYLRDNYDFTDDLIYRGGLRVYTTVNYKMQVAAQSALTSGIEDARRSGKMSKTKGQGALVCIEPGTGYIRAMVGGTDYGTSAGKSVFNRAVQARRQPGSSFKIFVYTAAVDMLGWNANTTVQGGHYSHHVAGGPTWTPRNYDGIFWGSMPMRRAVAKSVNIPAIKTAEKVGLKNVINYAHMMGIKSEIEPYPALAIGGIGGINVLEMCSAYGVIADGGTYIEPTPIAKITDSKGQTIEPERAGKGKQVLPPETVKVMDELFRGVVTSSGGTGYAVRSVPEARGKTGTTNSDVDAWFIGYVPNKLVTAVWAGNDNHTGMNNVWGGNVCAPIWKEFMLKALRVFSDTHETTPKPVHIPSKPSTPAQPTDQNPPATTTDNTDNNTGDDGLATVKVKICDDSQLLATSNCPHWHTEQFADGTQPTQYCNLHGKKRHHNNDGQTPDNGTNDNTDDGLRLTPPPTMTGH